MLNLQCANWQCFLEIFCHQLTLKNIRQVYAQHKGFSRFNWTLKDGLKIDESRKLGLQKLQVKGVAESVFFKMKLALLKVINWIHKNKIEVATFTGLKIT